VICSPLSQESHDGLFVLSGRQAQEVNPDTHLVLTFPGPPILHNSGQIRIYDAADDRLVDTLDHEHSTRSAQYENPAPL